MEDIQEKYNYLLMQIEALRQENEELKSPLHAHGIEYKPKQSETLNNDRLTEICQDARDLNLPRFGISTTDSLTRPAAESAPSRSLSATGIADN